MSKTINIGKVAMTTKGRWSADTSYEYLDVVYYNGALWAAKGASVGEEPSEESETWSILIDNAVSDGDGGVFIYPEQLEFTRFANYYDPTDPDIVLGKYIYNGEYKIRTTNMTTGFIEVEGSTTYCFRGHLASPAVFSVCQYDADKTCLSTLGGSGSESIESITTDADTKYIKVSFLKMYASTFTIEKREAPKLIGSKHAYYIPEELIIDEAEPLALLPDDIYVAEGRTIEIYNRGVCPAADKYHFRWSCDVGRAYEKKFSITGTSANLGEYPLTLEICNDRLEVVWRKTATVKIVSSTISTSQTICPIGDVHSAGRYWMKEVGTLSDSTISFNGSLTGEYGRHEGRAGWSSDMVCTQSSGKNLDTGTSVANALVTGTAFNWKSYGMPGITSVQLFFGEREFFIGNPAVTAESLNKMITSVRVSKTYPIFVVLPPLWGTQDAMSNKNANHYDIDFSLSYKYNSDVALIRGAKTVYESIKNAGFSDVYFIPMTCCYDSENNYQTEEVALSPRSSETVTVQTNALIPSQQGYEQMADILFSAYCAIFGSTATTGSNE